MKNVRIFLSENFPFPVVKFSIYLNRRVFVMTLDELHTVEPQRQITYLFICAPCEDSFQPAHSRSLIIHYENMPI